MQTTTRSQGRDGADDGAGGGTTRTRAWRAGVRRVAAAGVTAVLAGTLGAAGAAAAPPPVVAGTTASTVPAGAVEWALSSTGTFGGAVTDALRTQARADVAASLDGFAAVAASGATVDFPGLDRLAPAEAAVLAASTADAVAAGAPLPAAAAALALEPASGATSSTGAAGARPLVAAARSVLAWLHGGTPDGGRVVAGGLAYEHVNWLRRGVSDEAGNVEWTDQLRLRWTTTPGARTSLVVYRFDVVEASTGYYGPATAQTVALVDDAEVGTGPVVALRDGAVVVRTVTNRPSAYGAALRHETTLFSTGSDGLEWSVFEQTPPAACADRPAQTCRYDRG